MQRLFLLLLSISVGTMAGIGVIVVLVLGYVSLIPILVAAGIGAALGIPAAWVIARRITAHED
ncbi:hypothetical protein JHW45_09095 [Paracoccus stylophorae]|uniref:CTP synthetase n=1 Tax=Paracoccus stylophorae TaxID=659350 RepID=A0ABY7SQJ2_9RHOB|nr:hypothetical protein [Paracoccus stylophorae]WCR09290.1 hypothetical protein JHW45_09095 [Paracoccus stylophorae]